MHADSDEGSDRSSTSSSGTSSGTVEQAPGRRAGKVARSKAAQGDGAQGEAAQDNRVSGKTGEQQQQQQQQQPPPPRELPNYICLTARRSAANRRNAARSTGPRTARGKARAARNALKHGAWSRTAVLPAERRAAWAALCAEAEADLRPRGFLQRELVGRIASVCWRLRRVARAQERAARDCRDGEQAHWWFEAIESDMKTARANTAEERAEAAAWASTIGPQPPRMTGLAALLREAERGAAGGPMLLFAAAEERLDRSLVVLMREFIRLREKQQQQGEGEGEAGGPGGGGGGARVQTRARVRVGVGARARAVATSVVRR